MATTKTGPLDIEDLMTRIRAEVSQRKIQNEVRKHSEQAPYILGDVLTFSTGGSAELHLAGGWAYPEAEHRWTNAESATLLFKFEEKPKDLVLSFTVKPNLAAAVACQDVTALWNDTPVGSWSIGQSGTFRTLILSQTKAGDQIHSLTFLIPSYFSPSSKRLSEDPRKLGLAFVELVLQPAADFGFDS